MRRLPAAVVVCALIGLIVPLAARADHCEGEKWNVILHSRIGAGDVGTYSYSSKDIGCDVGESPNTNYLYPGSNQVLVRYAEDLKVPSIKAKVTGLGLDKDLTLKRGESTLGAATSAVLGIAYIYDSPWIDIDPTKTGKITVTVMLDSGPVTDEYRTVGS